MFITVLIINAIRNRVLMFNFLNFLHNVNVSKPYVYTVGR